MCAKGQKSRCFLRAFCSFALPGLVSSHPRPNASMSPQVSRFLGPAAAVPRCRVFQVRPSVTLRGHLHPEGSPREGHAAVLPAGGQVWPFVRPQRLPPPRHCPLPAPGLAVEDRARPVPPYRLFSPSSPLPALRVVSHECSHQSRPWPTELLGVTSLLRNLNAPWDA